MSNIEILLNLASGDLKIRAVVRGPDEQAQTARFIEKIGPALSQL